QGEFSKQISLIAQRLIDDRHENFQTKDVGTFWRQCIQFINTPLKLVSQRRKATQKQEAKVEPKGMDQETKRFVEKLIKLLQIMSGELKDLRDVLDTSDLSAPSSAIESDLKEQDRIEPTVNKPESKPRFAGSSAEQVTQAIELGVKGRDIYCDMNIQDGLILTPDNNAGFMKAITEITHYAARLTPKGKSVRIRAENIYATAGEDLPIPEGTYGRVTIEDQGIGMSESVLAKLLHPRPENKVSDSPLARASALITEAGGYISARSELEVGTIYTLYAPISQASRQAQDATAA
ncbi:MAG: ATP-binding protein, partial [Gammaproteobacteria bacterium]|nr:ATP-binding protein [Gammaproteobacteria bacterium]